MASPYGATQLPTDTSQRDGVDILDEGGTTVCGEGGTPHRGVRGHKWHRFRREGVDMRECKRCGYLVRRDADPPRIMGADGGF